MRVRKQPARSLTRLTGVILVGTVGIAPAFGLQTKTAVSAGAAFEFPAPLEGGFEDPSITGSSLLSGWNSWTMSSSGIAANGSPISGGNPNAPEGTHVAFLQGASTIQATYAFPVGTWRLNFKTAQRSNGGQPDQQTLRITIGSVEVFEGAAPSTAYAESFTRPLVFTSPTVRTVTFEGLDTLGSGHVVLLDEVRLEPVADWGSTSTWGGSVPSGTDTVMIPSGVPVALTGTSVAATIDVFGELLAGDRNIDLDTDGITVDGVGARFEVGLPLTPFEQDFVLTLQGSPTPGVNTKRLLAANAGTIEMHGLPRGFNVGNGRERSWTKLDADALVGDTSIVVAEPVNWQPGDLIVLAGSLAVEPDNPVLPWDESEVAEVSVVHPSGVDIDLVQPLTYQHFGSALPSVSNGVRTWNIDERAEVGLLTHNVKVQGDANSEVTSWGGHVMMMRPGPAATGGIGRFSSVEFYRMGQKQELGRYPLHWHMQLDQGYGQYAKNCSIRRSYNRAMTIHGTDGVLLEGNVAYDHMGHGVFLEDGSERFNQVYHNLALLTRRPLPGEEMIKSDNEFSQLQNRSPATYWITNPNNEFVGNAAAGTVGTGFWLIFSPDPVGLSATPAYAASFAGLHPDKEPLGLFADNLCHSSGSGLDIHDRIDPVTDGVIANHRWEPATSAVQYLDRFTAYGCKAGIYTGGGTIQANLAIAVDQVRFRDTLLVDNESHLVFAGFDVVEDSCVVARSGSWLNPALTFAYTIYDGPGRVYETHFEGFGGVSETFLNHIGAGVRHVNHRLRGLTFDGQWPTMGMSGGYDDPSISGAVLLYEIVPGLFAGSLVNDTPLLRSPADIPYPNPHIWTVQYPGLVVNPYWSPLKFSHLRISHPGLTVGTLPPYTAVPAIKLTRNLVGAAPVSVLHSFDQWSHRQFPVAVNAPTGSVNVDYKAHWRFLPPSGPIRLEFDDKDTAWIPPGSHLTMELVPLGSVSNLTVTVNGVTLPGPIALASLPTAPATAYAVVGNSLHLRMVSTGRRDTVTLDW
jgi:hypothetical protein